MKTSEFSLKFIDESLRDDFEIFLQSVEVYRYYYTPHLDIL